MIAVLQNEITKRKHTLNLVDHNGRVMGFNPYPGNHRIEWELTDEGGKDLIGDEDIAIEKYLIGIPFHFGKNAIFERSKANSSFASMKVDLVSDNLAVVNHLTVHGEGGNYYVDDIGLSDSDKAALFSEESISKWRTGRWAEMYANGLGNRPGEEDKTTEPSVTAGNEAGDNFWCTQDCVWMGPEIDRLKKENIGLLDLVKRLADELEQFCDGGCKRDEVLREARELKDIDKKDCDAFCPRVRTLEEMLNQQTKTCDDLRWENTALIVRLQNAEKL